MGSKANLIALAGDQAWAEVTLPDPAAVSWRTAAAAMATGLHAMLIRHPWVVQAFGSYPMFGPGKARHDDHLLAIYEAAGFPAEEADQATAAVCTYVLGNALGPAAAASLTRKLSREGGDAGKRMGDTLARAGTSQRSSPGCTPASKPPLPATTQHPSTASSSACKPSSMASKQADLESALLLVFKRKLQLGAVSDRPALIQVNILLDDFSYPQIADRPGCSPDRLRRRIFP